MLYVIHDNHAKGGSSYYLKDDTVLYFRETVLSKSIRKYAYHWQDQNGKLIMRWDNAPDWDVETFPHHLHIGKADIEEPSFHRTLSQILDFIRNKIDAC